MSPRDFGFGEMRYTDVDMNPIADRTSFEELFRSQSDKLRRMAFHFLHDDATADDAVQEAFTRGLAHLHRYRGEAAPEVWLYSIALNVCRQVLRRSRSEEALAERQAERNRNSGRGPVTSLIRREDASKLALALGHLTDLQREAFILHYVEELAYEDIAPMLGVSVTGARGLAHRARNTLRTKLPPGFELPRAR